MIKIGEVKGEKGFFKEVFAENYYGTFDFKLKFDDVKSNCEVKNSKVLFCSSDHMAIEIWADLPNLKEYNFVIKTFKIQQL